MSLTNWSFADGLGVTLCEGWQGHEDQARELAQQYANERGEPVDFWRTDDARLQPYAADGAEVPSETVWPDAGHESRAARQERIGLELAEEGK